MIGIDEIYNLKKLVTESSRLEKTIKITESHHGHNLSSPTTTPRPLAPCPHVFLLKLMEACPASLQEMPNSELHTQ